MHSTHHILEGDADVARDMARHAWSILAKNLELLTQDLPCDGVGQADTPKRRIQWVCADAGAVLAVQGIDKARGRCWELSIIQLPANRIVLRAEETVRELLSDPGGDSVRLEEDTWTELAASHELGDIKTPSNPTFPAIVAAALNGGGLASIRDESARILSLEHDLQYWRDLAKSQAKILKQRPQTQPTAAQTATESPTEVEPERQWRLGEIEEWASLHSDQIVILPRAVSEAKKSHYENDALVFDCLHMLANEYRQVKAGEAPRNTFRDRAAELGVEVGGSVDPSNAGEEGDQYFIRWGGQRRFLDQHLSKGSSRDKRFSMRIYYTWDDEDRKVIVGWLPSHLNNSRT